MFVTIRKRECAQFIGRRLLSAGRAGLVFAAAVTLMMCSAAAGEETTPETVLSETSHVGTARADGSWALYLYLCGSNLESRQGWATKTLKELQNADIPDNVTVVVQAGGSRKWMHEDVQRSGQRLLVKSGELLDTGSTGTTSMGEADAFADFLMFCETEYPADHTAVVLWDHGGGPLKGVCFDELDFFDALSLDELAEGLGRGVDFRGGRPYDIVGFDACLMGSMETAVTLKGNADWMVASEEIESGAGWDYAPILAAMGEEGTDARKVAVSVCDGYKAKCLKRGKAAGLTLAALDLSHLPVLEEALEEVYTALKENVGLGIGSLRRLAFGARVAEDFGASTGEGSISNLIDLKGLADACAEAYGTEDVPWDTLSDAVDEVVACRVNGKATSGAAGISIWYPITREGSNLDDYIASTPFKGYAAVLKELFSLEIGEISFADAGSVDEEGTFHVTIASEAAESFYDIFVINKRADGSYEDRNVDRIDDWENLSFAWQPKYAVEVVLNGMPLDVRAISYTDDYIVFSSPVRINGEESFLRICYVTDEENPEGGYYELLGIWNGVDHVSGLADRFLDSLEPGDEVEALSLNGQESRGIITVEDEVEITDKPMEPGEYVCCFLALDLYGRGYPSAVCRYVVDESGEVTAGMRGSRGKR